MSVNKYDATHDLLLQIAGSGSEGSFHRTQAVQALAGATSVTISDSRIHATSLVTPFADNGTNEPIAWKTMTLSEGSCVITFDALEADTDFELVVLADSLTEDAYLNDLSDIDLSNPTNGQVIGYNGATGKWVNINASGGGILPHLVISTDSGLTVTVTKGTTTITATETSEGIYECDVTEFGTYSISDTENTIDVVIDTVTIYQIPMTPPVPEGATVTPTDDIETWIKCAGLENTNNYTSLAEVMADTDLFDTLLRDSNACDYMARSTTWALQSGLVPQMTSNTTPSGEVIGYTSATTTSTPTNLYKVFGGYDIEDLNCSSATTGAFGYHFDTPTIVQSVLLNAEGTSGTADIKNFKVQGSNDGSDWTDLCEGLYPQTVGTVKRYSFANSTAYSYYRVLRVDSWAGRNYLTFINIQFYAEADITTDRDAMARIGKYDYCADKLSSNSTWAQAIGNSAYMDSVWDTSVPKMTSDTTPEGECIYSDTYSASYPAWKAFDNDENSEWQSKYYAIGSYIGYHFTKPVVIHRVRVYSAYFTYKIQGSNDGTTWADLDSNSYGYVSGSTQFGYSEETIDNNTAYEYIRLLKVGQDNSTSRVPDIQFYGRADSTVYSPLVPVMTSATTPSGQASANSEYTSSSYYAWKAFNPTEERGWFARQTGFSTDDYIEYEFPSARAVANVTVSAKATGSGSNYFYFKITRYNGSEWEDVSSEQYLSMGSTSSQVYSINFDLNSVASYSRYRLVMTRNSENMNGLGLKIQFYSKTTATTKVHSCPNDTLYITDGVDTEVLCTTDSNGIGSIDWSEFDAGKYAIYSSVAKDPSNLTNDYKKIVRVTNTAYGHTTDAYIMPDAINMLYWYGYEDANLEDCSTANGWSVVSGHSFIAPTHNTNYIAIESTQGNSSGVGNKNAIYPAVVHNISECTYNNYGGGDTHYTYLESTNSKYASGGATVTNTQKNTIEHLQAQSTGKYLTTYMMDARKSNLYAMWYE